MGIAELFEIGFFAAFWDWSTPILTGIVYFFVMVGVVLQIMLQKKGRKPMMKWLLICICGVAIVISECLWQAITGWDRLLIDIIYGAIICLLLGAGITMIALFLVKNKK